DALALCPIRAGIAIDHSAGEAHAPVALLVGETVAIVVPERVACFGGGDHLTVAIPVAIAVGIAGLGAVVAHADALCARGGGIARLGGAGRAEAIVIRQIGLSVAVFVAGRAAVLDGRRHLGGTIPVTCALGVAHLGAGVADADAFGTRRATIAGRGGARHARA